MSDMEARRIVCDKGHLNAILKTYPGKEGDAFANAHLALVCVYCGSPMKFESATIEDFERYKSREDGRYVGNGAP